MAAEEFSERRFVAWVIGSPQGGASLGVAVLYVLLVIVRQMSENSPVKSLEELNHTYPRLIDSLPDLGRMGKNGGQPDGMGDSLTCAIYLP